MSDPFVHLHVASGYSLRYGAAHPHELVRCAADHGMDALALTDRDGLYGAVKFVQACRAAGVRPVLGVDLAVPPADAAGRRPRRRTPARGGAEVDRRRPRVTVLADGARGWAALCRLVSAAHAAGERGDPVSSAAGVGDAAGRTGGRLVVVLGPASPLGRSLARRRPDLAAAELRRWQEVIPAADLFLEVVHHQGPGQGELAGRMLRFALDHRLPAVLTNAVRAVGPQDAPTTDVLDAARRLVVLGPRHVDRLTAQAYLKSGKEMAVLAEEAARLAGAGPREAARLLSATRQLAERCVLDPTEDLGIGRVHFPEFTGAGTEDPMSALRRRAEEGFARRGMAGGGAAADRLEHELAIIRALGYPTYFLTVADVVTLIRGMGVRCAARGSGAGSLVNYLLGISDVDPLAYGLVMERFLSPSREALPDIDLDVESARRTEVYEAILDRYGGHRCACVSMMDTYRARHAIRDVGAALGMPPEEIDAVAKAFPHIRAAQVRAAVAELPELRAAGFAGSYDLLFRLVERLDGLPRHVALHPCGVLLSDATLLDRTPVEPSAAGFPMSQFDKDDVEDLGLLKLDVLGVRMQSAIAHAVAEVRRVDGVDVDIDRVPRDDPATFALIRSTRTLGCFQIESPGQRELVGKFGPADFTDIIIDISLFRPGPVKTDMVTPFLEARHGWRRPSYLHPDLRPVLAETEGVVVFHEQVLQVIATFTGCSLAEADEARRALADPTGIEEVAVWFKPTACARGYPAATVEAVWAVLAGFASFGFCKAHAAAFAVPTYQSAWLKAHHPAAFFAGVLTHDPGMYPKRLILDDARQFGVAVLPLDVNRSTADYRVEPVGVADEPPPGILGSPPRPDPGTPDGRAYGIRLALADVRGITDAEVERIVARRPYGGLADFWQRAGVSRPVVERLILAGGFDALYRLGASAGAAGRRRGRVTRRDLLLQVAELDAWTRGRGGRQPVTASRDTGVQLAFDLAAAVPEGGRRSGLPEMTAAERVAAELDVLGLDASRHVLAGDEGLLRALGVTRARDLLRCRSGAEILVAGVKVATQTPPVRSGRRVVFLTLDDATGPVDATFFEDAQADYAATIFHSWLLVVRGTVRRTGMRGVSLNGIACWDLTRLRAAWQQGGLAAAQAVMSGGPASLDPAAVQAAVAGAAGSRSTRPVMASRKLWHASPGSAGR